MERPTPAIPVVTPPWMDAVLHDAMRDRAWEQAPIAWRVCHLLTTQELLALRQIPCRDGLVFGDSRVLLELCRAALLGVNLRGEWTAEARSAVQIAAESVSTMVRSYAFTGSQTVDDLIGLILWDLSGRMYVEPADRAAYGLAAKACLHVGVYEMRHGDERFTFLMHLAEGLLIEGLDLQLIQDDLSEHASMLFHGISEPDHRAHVIAESERTCATRQAEAAQAIAGKIDFAEALGISETHARDLMAYEIVTL